MRRRAEPWLRRGSAGRSASVNVFEHVGKGLPAFQDALFQDAEILLQQDHIGRIFGGVDGRIDRYADIGLAQGRDVIDAIA